MNHLENMKLKAEIKKLTAEADHLMVTTRWYPLVVATGLVAGLITLTKVFL